MREADRPESGIPGQMDIFDFIEVPKTPPSLFEQLFEEIKDPVMPCPNCLCQYCANNVEGIRDTVKPEEIRESCFNCGECRTFTGRKKHVERARKDCPGFRLSEYGAEKNRKRFRIVSGRCGGA